VSTTFAVGERALLLDVKRRRYLIELKEGGEFHSHAGYVPHADIVGATEGVVVRSTRGAEYTVLRPTLEDFVVEMPRGAQVIYPKDLAPICMLADIGPGVRVFESGVGSGALSMTMLRWGAEIVGYEIREDFANRARSNVRSFLGAEALDRYDVRLASSYEGIDPAAGPFDRVVLDLPEPWQVVPHAEAVLRPGGILVAYTPSITQATQTREQMKGRWIDARTIEVMHRGWHIEGHAVRPDHRMVAHTGFLSVARFLGPGVRRAGSRGYGSM
jgi:tRNA (adenine57-N1/adenine58-N1)-methyltransferase